MLNRAKVMKELQRVSDRLVLDTTHEAHLARDVWKKISADPIFAYKLKTVTTPWLVPSWMGRLDDVVSVEQRLDAYRVLAVDGSQIYPDRHQGTFCSLINVGTVELNYGVGDVPVMLNSSPTVFTGDEDAHVGSNPHDVVDCRRQEFEFRAGLTCGEAIQKKCEHEPFLFLFDGSLIFWYLETKERAIKERFLVSYLDTLEQLYQQKIVLAGYISLTKSKELVNLVRIALTEFAGQYGFAESMLRDHATLDYLSDAQIVRFFLNPFERTTIFKNHSAVTKHYPPYLHPHFFYLHVGSEVVRVEIPAWIASSPESVQTVSRVIADQCTKGGGYPVALAEAHEQAVVKGPDRDFFYLLIEKTLRKEKHPTKMSRKLHFKRAARV